MTSLAIPQYCKSVDHAMALEVHQMSKQLQDAYIVAATRTPFVKAPRGAFRHTRPDSLLAHVLRSVLGQVPQIEAGRVEDVIVGCAMPEYEQGMNVARIGLLLA